MASPIMSVATIVVGALALVFWTRPTGWVVILLVVAVLLVVGVVRLIAEVGRRADAETAEVAIEAGAPDEGIVEVMVVDVADETFR